MSKLIDINILEIIKHVAVYTEILPILFYLSTKRRLVDKGLWVIFFLPTVSFINNIYAFYLGFYEHRSNFLFYNLEQLTETYLLYYFFYFIVKNVIIRKVVLVLCILYLFLWIASLLKFGNTKYYSSCTNFQNMTVLGLVIFYYYEQIIIINSAFIYGESIFWIVTAFFIYTAGTFFLYLFIPSFDLAEQQKYYDGFNSIFTILRTILISVAIFVKKDNGKNDSNNFNKSSGLLK